MPRAVVALAIAGIALFAGMLAQRPERAAADYNIAGEWVMELNGGLGLCQAIVAEAYDNPPTYALSMTVSCVPFVPFGKMTGSIDANTGSFAVSRIDGDPNFGGTFSMSGTVSPDNHSMSGTWTAHTHVTPGLGGPFTGTGGDGGPKPGTPTPTASATATATATQTIPSPAAVTPSATPTPDPVGGVAFDVPRSSTGALVSWWLAAMAGAAFVVVGGAAYARRRG